jgi:hypothetical protein
MLKDRGKRVGTIFQYGLNWSELKQTYKKVSQNVISKN